MSRLQGAENDIFTPKVEFGDEIDPVLKEKIDTLPELLIRCSSSYGWFLE